MHKNPVVQTFQYNVTRNLFDPGDRVNDSLQRDGRYTVSDKLPYIWLFTRGVVRTKNLTLGTFTDWHPGHTTMHKEELPGEYEMEVLESAELWCWSRKLNKNIDFNGFEYFSLEQGETKELPRGTQLFLASGAAWVNGALVAGPKQISVSSPAVEIAGETNCYGMIINK